MKSNDLLAVLANLVAKYTAAGESAAVQAQVFTLAGDASAVVAASAKADVYDSIVQDLRAVLARGATAEYVATLPPPTREGIDSYDRITATWEVEDTYLLPPFLAVARLYDGAPEVEVTGGALYTPAESRERAVAWLAAAHRAERMAAFAAGEPE